MKSKFKPGDKVVVLDGRKIENYAFGWDSEMKAYVGDTLTITEPVYDKYRDQMGYKMKDTFFKFDERGLVSAKQGIFIFRNDRKVIAMDKATGKKAEARCNPLDTFDFYTGAKLALDRLIGTQTPAERDLKIGDIVVANKKADWRYAITKRGWRGVVTEIVSDGKFRAQSLPGSRCGEYELNLEFFDVVGTVIDELRNAKSLSDEILFELVKGLIGKDAISRLFGYAFKHYAFELRGKDIEVLLRERCETDG